MSQWWIALISSRNIAVSKLLFECYKLMTALLEYIIAAAWILPFEANLFQSFDSVLWEVGRHFIYLLFSSTTCISYISHAPKPTFQ